MCMSLISLFAMKRRLNMGYMAFDKKEKEYQKEVIRLTEIAVEVYNSDRGVFLKGMAHAWIWADSSDRRILRPAWLAIVTKYSLAEEAGV